MPLSMRRDMLVCDGRSTASCSWPFEHAAHAQEAHGSPHPKVSSTVTRGLPLKFSVSQVVQLMLEVREVE
jgi:hypothetical protein